MPRSRFIRVEIGILGILSALAAVMLVIFSRGASRGFDFTDEGSYYLSFAHPEYVSDNQTSYHLFGAKLFGLLGHNIIAMRFATLALVVGGTAVFLWGWQRFRESFGLFPCDTPTISLLTVSGIIASFVGFSVAPAAPSYNFQNAACLLAAVGFLLAAAARPRSERLLDIPLLGLLAGFASLGGLDFFVKFSSSVPTLFGGAVFFFLVSRQSIRIKIMIGGLLFGGLLTVAIVYFAFIQPFSAWRAGITGTFNAVFHGQFGTEVARRYLSELVEFSIRILRSFAWLWIATAIGLFALRAFPLGRPRRTAAIALYTLCVTSLLVIVIHAGYWRNPGHYGLPFFVGQIALFALLGTGLCRIPLSANSVPPRPTWPLFLASGLLFLLPYVGAFGTSNNINGNLIFQLAPWIALSGLPLASLDRSLGRAWPSGIGWLLIAGVAAGQFYEGYWNQPYRVGGSRSDQTELTAIGEPATLLRLRPLSHEFIVTARHALQTHGYKAGDDLLVLFDLPGVVFALGGVSPGHTWYFAGSENALYLDLMRLKFIEPERRRRAVIVRNGSLDEAVPLLRKADLNFPDDYELITPPMKSPFTGVPFEIWMPKNR